jgi:hypothetical protein
LTSSSVFHGIWFTVSFTLSKAVLTRTSIPLLLSYLPL